MERRGGGAGPGEPAADPIRQRVPERDERGARLGAEELALAVLLDCRSFAGGELTDDCAVVVIRRLPGA